MSQNVPEPISEYLKFPGAHASRPFQISDVTIIEPHSNLYIVRVFQQCMRKCCKDCTKKFGIW